ncbi:DUF4011 domain-containing protein [Terriglobus sp.]
MLAFSRKAQENSEEKGLQTLYLAVGFLRWPAETAAATTLALRCCFPFT